ncbi:malate synthase G [Planctobacterium marinum]|uniref:Malate synthase G n=1 Tax=Planctobacterium marinum TaxID=1631968 RepID=A0AA48HQM7_9ALTE|nr:malate synthase G [Planctobacterium marinum]
MTNSQGNSKANYITSGQLSIHPALWDFINKEALPAVKLDQNQFWQDFEALLGELQPINQALLEKRDALQLQIDSWHNQHPEMDFATYKQFLQEIGYLVNPPEDFQVSTQNVDPEIATMAGPQLVVPINNARYALNAANARWGSLYDALYGTDVLPGEADKSLAYDPARGKQVVEWVKNWLDEIFPLQAGSHKDVTGYLVSEGELVMQMQDGSTQKLKETEQFCGYRGDAQAPTCILLQNNGLHAEIAIDASHIVGEGDLANVKDVVLEAALTTIMDCEDSVAAVDGEDKTLVYQNWAGLIRGDLSLEMRKGDKVLVRSLNKDRNYTSKSGDNLTLPGRSLMFVRNVGHLMTNNAIYLENEEVFEGLMDAVVTCLIAKQDVQQSGKYRNSKTGSIYIVKPKMHGPEEVAFSNDLFSKVESMLGLAPDTIKIGIMDEERRTSVNLKACIAAAKSRVAFINTGFLDRTGDEIHTSMQCGPFARKAELKTMPWIQAYEKSNVAAGLSCGLAGKAQIGKGMWPEPDNMAKMMSAKTGHVKSGANTAWVPSPTAATLHALHYHQISVSSMQQALSKETFDGLDDILTIPVKPDVANLSPEEIADELDNNVQGILGYVVRWVHQGVGCSKVPDINDVGLMEDRATLRISSQHIANWLEHGIVSEAQVRASMEKMAKLVDQQNAGDPEYIAMCPEPDSAIAYQAAAELIFEGKRQPSGYTEPVLHRKRLEMKATQR